MNRNQRQIKINYHSQMLEFWMKNKIISSVYHKYRCSKWICVLTLSMIYLYLNIYLLLYTYLYIYWLGIIKYNNWIANNFEFLTLFWTYVCLIHSLNQVLFLIFIYDLSHDHVHIDYHFIFNLAYHTFTTLKESFQ